MASAGYRVILDEPNRSRFTTKQIDDAIRKVKALFGTEEAKKSRPQRVKARARTNGKR